MENPFRKKKTLDLSKFQGLQSRDIEAINRYSATVDKHEALLKREKRQQRSTKIDSVLRQAGKAFPKGIRHPDSLVHNEELYVGHKVKKKGVRLF